jgi:peptide deformylase
MTVRRVIRLGHPTLRRIAEPVEQNEVKKGAFEGLAEDLVETMRDYQGVGIAAPQVNVSIRMFVIEVKANNERYPGREEFPATTFINPEVTFLGEREVFSPEGCLSIPDFRGVARRFNRVKVKALDLAGEPFELNLEGFPAIVAQHEFDHLGGHLFIDRRWSDAALGYEAETDRFESLKREALDSVHLAD